MNAKKDNYIRYKKEDFSMKKSLFVLLVLFVLSTSSLYAKENFDYATFNGISLGGGATVSPTISGGFFDFGFNFYSKNIDKGGEFYIRNYLEIMGGGMLSSGIFGFRERLFFGATHAITDQFGIRGYGGMDFGILISGNENKDFFAAPYLLEFRGVGGVEFLLNMESSSGGSIFVEAGGGPKFSIGGDVLDTSGNGFISFGGRYYF